MSLKNPQLSGLPGYMSQEALNHIREAAKAKALPPEHVINRLLDYITFLESQYDYEIAVEITLAVRARERHLIAKGFLTEEDLAQDDRDEGHIITG